MTYMSLHCKYKAKYTSDPRMASHDSPTPGFFFFLINFLLSVTENNYNRHTLVRTKCNTLNFPHLHAATPRDHPKEKK